MNQQTMCYKDYTASIRWSDESGCFMGKVTNLDNPRHAITFSGGTLAEIQEEFKGMMDWYLETRERDGKKAAMPVPEAVANTV
jgi:predicted HicB family RNase H-like nuclease